MGNPGSYLGWDLSWEGKQLTEAERIVGTSSAVLSYSYNEDGLRLRKQMEVTMPNGTYSSITDYCYNGSVLIGMKTGTGSTAKILRFSYDASGNVAAVDYSSDNGNTFTSYYYLRNAQGDIVKLIDSSGNTVVEYTYDSWGRIIATTGSLANTVGADQPFRYRGYVYDEETGWYYLQSRYYDPTTCRFISADVLLSTGQGIIGHNAFAYCGNNPIIRIDDEGTFFLTACLVILGVSALVGGVFGGINEVQNDGSFMEGFACGFVEGAIAAVPAAIIVGTGGTAAPLEMAVYTAVYSGTGSATSYVMDCCIKGNPISGQELRNKTLIGAASGVIGGGIMGAFTSAPMSGMLETVIRTGVPAMATEAINIGANVVISTVKNQSKQTTKPLNTKLSHKRGGLGSKPIGRISTVCAMVA